MADTNEMNEATREFIGQNYISLTPERIKEYHDRGADLNVLWKDGSTLLQKLCHMGQGDIEFLGILEKIKSLMENGADPNVKDETGWSTLDYVFDSGETGVVEKLKLLAPYLNEESLDKLKETHPAAAKLIEGYKTEDKAEQ